MTDLEKRVASLESAVAEMQKRARQDEDAARRAREQMHAIATDAAVDEACLLAGLDPVDR